MIEAYLWNGLVLALFLVYTVILYRVREKKRYFFYFALGAALGFYFDIVSYMNGYYTYHDFYKLTFLGLPISMTLAEGFSVAITLYIFEFLYTCFKKKSIKRTYLP